jgi:hypothetical protein
MSETVLVLNPSGQWFGHSVSNPAGNPTAIIVNIEPRSLNNAVLIGVDGKTQERMIASADLRSEGKSFTGRTYDYQVYDSAIHSLVPLAVYYKNRGIAGEQAREAEYSGEFDGTKITGTFKNNLNQTGNFTLWRSFSEAQFGKPVPKPEDVKGLTWQEFKRDVKRFCSKGRYLFRGQHSSRFPLRTTFHRKNRNNLPLYLLRDVSRLRHQINAISSYL